MTDLTSPILEARAISKSFAQTRALVGANLTCGPASPMRSSAPTARASQRFPASFPVTSVATEARSSIAANRSTFVARARPWMRVSPWSCRRPALRRTFRCWRTFSSPISAGPAGCRARRCAGGRARFSPIWVKSMRSRSTRRRVTFPPHSASWSRLRKRSR